MIEHVQNWQSALKNETAKLNRRQLDERIEAYVKFQRPKEVRKYEENGHTITVYEPRYGCATNVVR